jgi:hypothetical protein
MVSELVQLPLLFFLNKLIKDNPLKIKTINNDKIKLRLKYTSNSNIKNVIISNKDIEIKSFKLSFNFVLLKTLIVRYKADIIIEIITA